MRTKIQSCLKTLWLTKQHESAGGLHGTATILETLLLPFPLVYLVGQGKYMMVQNNLKSSGFLLDNDYLSNICRSIIPYFYPIYLFTLLIWRERRDEARCNEKYQDLWKQYCKVVPWRIFPYLY